MYYDPEVALFDDDGKENESASMGADGIVYYDENGTRRAQLGVVDAVSKTFREKLESLKTGKSLYPAGVALFDDDGNVIWMAPQ